MHMEPKFCLRGVVECVFMGRLIPKQEYAVSTGRLGAASEPALYPAQPRL